MKDPRAFCHKQSSAGSLEVGQELIFLYEIPIQQLKKEGLVFKLLLDDIRNYESSSSTLQS